MEANPIPIEAKTYGTCPIMMPSTANRSPTRPAPPNAAATIHNAERKNPNTDVDCSGNGDEREQQRNPYRRAHDGERP